MNSHQELYTDLSHGGASVNIEIDDNTRILCKAIAGAEILSFVLVIYLPASSSP